MNINGVTAVLSDPSAPTPQFTITDVGTNGESLTFEPGGPHIIEEPDSVDRSHNRDN